MNGQIITMVIKVKGSRKEREIEKADELKKISELSLEGP